jgi:beta-ureidopropionase
MSGKNYNVTRRGFIQKASLGLGLGVLAGSGSAPAVAKSIAPVARQNRLPREVWIASLNQEGLRGCKNYKEVVKKAVHRMEQIAVYQPDIICLPEAFHNAGIREKPPLSERSEVPIGPITRPLAEYAKRHSCYVVAPIVTQEKGKYYNAAVIIDRNGQSMGEYRKTRLTNGEIESGLTCGPLEPPVFETDFGKIGVQICFDIEWIEGWKRLQKAGAEIVFWPSAFAGGKKLNMLAALHQYHVVSSTRSRSLTGAKICDITGEDIAWSGHWHKWGVCAPVNLEKAFLHTWPYHRRFEEIQAKYGRKIRIRTFHEEQWTVIESRSADVKVADVMKEFELLTYAEVKKTAEVEQEKHWK